MINRKQYIFTTKRYNIYNIVLKIMSKRVKINDTTNNYYSYIVVQKKIIKNIRCYIIINDERVYNIYAFYYVKSLN